MITYAKGEKDILIKSIIDKYGTHNSEFEEYTFVEIHGRSQRIPMDRLIQIVLYDETRSAPDFFMTIKGYFKEFFALIHYIPLIRVPLYLSTIPEVASWRLRVGK
jgi:hypothetical protein